MKYSVAIAVPVMVRVMAIEADTQAEAAQKAEDFIWENREYFHRTFCRTYDEFSGEPRFKYFEMGESGFIEACVDEEGDEGFRNSAWYVPNPKGEGYVPLIEWF